MFGFAGLERRVRNFVLDKAVDLLLSFKTKPLLKTSSESGLFNATQPPPTNDRLPHFPECERDRNDLRDLGDDDAQDTSSPSDRPIVQGVNQQPQFTKGPARFVIASDGSEDCLALLVTDTLIARLRALHEDSHHLSGKQGPLDYARREARDFETSINDIEELIEVADTQERAAELQEMIQEQQSQLLKTRQRRDELEKDTKQLERNVPSSKAHIQCVLDNAMREADLLKPHKSLTPDTMISAESDPRAKEDSHHNSNNRRYNAVENVTSGTDHPKQRSVHSVSIGDTSEELQPLHREVLESYNEALVTMHKVQALFDDRQQCYETDLADYQHGFANGIYSISRSDFDRSKIRYGQKLTRALINAEEAFEAAKVQAQAVGAIGSNYDNAASCYGCYEESWPESQLTSYLAKKDWRHVHEWLAEIPEPDERRGSELELAVEHSEIDAWYADEVDPADSISQIDFDECRKDIDRWETMRLDRWEDMRTQVGGPEVQRGFLVRNVESLKRRHSVSL